MTTYMQKYNYIRVYAEELAIMYEANKLKILTYYNLKDKISFNREQYNYNISALLSHFTSMTY